MQGSKNESKRRKYERGHGPYSGSWELGDFNRKIRKMPYSIEVPNGSYFKKVDVFFEWGS